jgi:DNA-binding response OmpR family regulator
MNILIAEDEDSLRILIKDYLLKEGFSIFEAANGKEALDIFKNEKIDFIILDIMMPELNGFLVLEEIRKISKIPVLILTALEEENEQLKGYLLGTDDYMLKPFSLKVLVAKVRAILNRANIKFSKYDFGLLKIDFDKKKAIFDGKEINLTATEFELLYYLIENKNVVKTRDQIIEKVWGYDFEGDERTVDTNIKRLRKKLNNSYIRTVWGFGYIFEDK